MQHSNHRTAALIASKPARIITSAALAVALTATPMLSPVAAYAASQATQDQLSAAQKKIEDATSAYNDARTKLEDLQKQIDSNEANIVRTESSGSPELSGLPLLFLSCWAYISPSFFRVFVLN